MDEEELSRQAGFIRASLLLRDIGDDAGWNLLDKTANGSNFVLIRVFIIFDLIS